MINLSDQTQNARIVTPTRRNKKSTKYSICTSKFIEKGINFPKGKELTPEIFIDLIGLGTEKEEKAIFVDILKESKLFSRVNTSYLIAYFSLKKEKYSEDKLNYLLKKYFCNWITEKYPDIKAEYPGISFVTIITMYKELSQV